VENQNNTDQLPEKKSALRVVVHSFFVVPFIIAIFAVLIFLVVRIMTAETNTAQDYLEDVKIGGTTKRWQGAFELSKILSNPALVPKDDRFVSEMISAFEYAANDRDVRVKQYLAVAMGATGDVRYASTLIESLKSPEPDLIKAGAYALGNIGDPSAVNPLLNLLDSGDPKVRLQAVISLGKIGDASAIPALKEMLADPEVNVRWDAAIALAKQKDRTGIRILLDLLDRKYLDSFPNIDETEQVQAMMVVIQVAHFVQDIALKESLETLRDSDSNLKIREAARVALTQFE
jgi:hypothetical protein|tara:strand:+ start:9799 stop:10668 length:870 start_codon:yes stop_codon:yes gene_type:complete